MVEKAKAYIAATVSIRFDRGGPSHSGLYYARTPMLNGFNPLSSRWPVSLEGWRPLEGEMEFQSAFIAVARLT